MKCIFKISIEVEASDEDTACKAARKIFLSSKSISDLCGDWEAWKPMLESVMVDEKHTVYVQ